MNATTSGVLNGEVDLPEVWCTAHFWYCESLRGSNRHRRVETLRCLMCGEKRRRVWNRLPAQRRPDREYRIGGAV